MKKVVPLLYIDCLFVLKCFVVASENLIRKRLNGKGSSLSGSSVIAELMIFHCFGVQNFRSKVVSKVLQIHRCGFSAPPLHKDQKLFKVISSWKKDSPTKYFDFIVIGSGIAGLRYALEVAKYGSVAVITKAESHECNTNYAQGGVSAVLCPSDSVESHIKDTIVAGAYLCDEESVRVCSAPIKSTF